MITWPYKYLAMGKNEAVLGGWDPSARKFFSTDELTFTVPYGMFTQITKRYSESFLMTKTWTTNAMYPFKGACSAEKEVQ